MGMSALDLKKSRSYLYRYSLRYHKVMVRCIAIKVFWFLLIFVNKCHMLLLLLLPLLLARIKPASCFHMQVKELDCSTIFLKNPFILWCYLCYKEMEYENYLIFSDKVKLENWKIMSVIRAMLVYDCQSRMLTEILHRLEFLTT